MDSLKALTSSYSPEAPVKGHSWLVGVPSILAEWDSPVAGVWPTISERGACPSIDHSEGDAHPCTYCFVYNSDWRCI